jgi:hypothetical protein
MTCRIGALATLALVSTTFGATLAPAHGADLPPVRLSETNKVAACATPGRLMAYLRVRNKALNPKYEHVAVEYMRHGESLGVRWDYAFFQMLLETGFLTYTGDVKPEQNNFAGLGATGGGARGESFKDVSSGVRAHLQHVLMYAGERIKDPIAQRTRKIQEWGILTDWQRSIRGPITYAQLSKQWAPGTRAYGNDIKTIADRFFASICTEPDPQPELVALARGSTAAKASTAQEDGVVAQGSVQSEAVAATGAAKGADTGAEKPRVLKKSLAESVPSGGGARAAAPASGTSSDSTAAGAARTATPPTDAPRVTVLNSPPAAPGAPAAAAAHEAGFETASVAGAATGAATDPGKSATESSPAKCRVWTASYGGTKAILIKAVSDQTVNYTVLDVNDGAEKRESEAYINAYAKGGESVGEFPTQAQALDKAFELCPEG